MGAMIPGGGEALSGLIPVDLVLTGFNFSGYRWDAGGQTDNLFDSA
jgi:hypothetical protein